MSGFIDLHSHLLFAVDDGPGDMEISFSLLNSLANLGFSKVVLTPHQATLHYNPSWSDVNNRFNMMLESWEGTTELYLGAENYYDEQFMQRLDQGQVPTLANSRSILLEFNPRFPPASIRELIFNIQINAYVPVIAHVERYPWLDTATMRRLKDSGAYLQVNLTALVDKITSPERISRAHKIIRMGLADILATDTHDTPWIEAASEAISWLESRYTSDEIERLLIKKPAEILSSR